MDFERVSKRVAVPVVAATALLSVASDFLKGWLNLFGDPAGWGWRQLIFCVGAIVLLVLA